MPIVIGFSLNLLIFRRFMNGAGHFSYAPRLANKGFDAQCRAFF
jgi:hypothetical protein